MRSDVPVGSLDSPTASYNNGAIRFVVIDMCL